MVLRDCMSTAYAIIHLLLILGSSVIADQDVSARRGVRGYEANVAATETKRDRSLLMKRLNDDGDKRRPIMKRMVLKCNATMSQENCLEEIISLSEGNINIIHSLPGIHSLALELDLSVLEDLTRIGMEIVEDPERIPLYLEDSIRIRHRDLQESSSSPEPSYALELIRATEVWEKYGVQGEGVKICVMDTGLYAEHPAFAHTTLSGWNKTGNFVVPWYQDAQGHGTHITGIMVASDDKERIFGVSPAVEIYMIRVFNNQGKFFGSDVVAAAQACKDAGSKVITMSLGGFGFDQGEHDMFQDLFLNDAILAVASSGNTGGPETLYPASYEHVLSVAACDKNKEIAWFSTFNSEVDIAAPGVNITSTWNNGTYATVDGTSMAAPHVAGTLALLISFKPEATAEELVSAVIGSAQPSSKVTNLDLGVVDAFAAIEALDSGILPRSSNSNCVQTELYVQSDDYAGEIAYRLRRKSDGRFIWKAKGLQNDREYVETNCLNPDDCYEFKIRDEFGDGILGTGIKLIYDGSVLVDGGDFGYGAQLSFGSSC